MNTDLTTARRNAAVPARRLAVLAAAAAVAACSPSDILKVKDIDVARPSSVSDSTALPALLDGAIGDFGFAYDGGLDFNQITLSGELSDELINTETFPTRIEVDERKQNYQNNGSLRDIFYATAQARTSADRASAAFLKFAPKDAGLAESLNLSALTYIIFAENYCGAVPVSTMDANQNITYGSPLNTQQLLDVAIAKADSALAIATDAKVTGGATYATQQARLARVVKARALLDENKPTEAAAAIGGTAGVPSNFQYVYTHSTTSGRQNNGTWGVTVSVGRFGVAEKEGGNGLAFVTEGDTAKTIKDPRVKNGRRSNNKGMGFDGGTPQWVQLKYPARDSKVVIADGVEARLIEAEAALATNYAGAGGTLEILNGLRSDPTVLAARGYAPGSLPALPDVSSGGATAEQDQLFAERAFWLYLTSHRLGDLRRLIKYYGRGAETVFPTGPYIKYGINTTYGTDVNSPIPQAEENNPNFKRSSCSTTAP